MTMIVLERTADTLPAGFPDLEAFAKATGHAHMTRLATEFTQDRAKFHAIFACRRDGRLAGIGAITDEPAARFWEAIGFSRVEGRAWSHEASVRSFDLSVQSD